MFSTLALEDFLSRHSQAFLNTTVINISFSSEVADVFASRLHRDRGKKFRFADPKNENFVEISYRNTDENGSMVVGVMYKNLTELFISDKNTRGTNETRVLNSIIMSVEIYPEPADVLLENITLVFKHIKAGGKSRECVFWDMFGDGPVGWSAQGCLTRIMSESQTECKCNHLTHFAVLMDITESKDESNARDTKENDKILTVLTHVGMALSLAGVSITIISYIRLTDRQAPLFHSRVGLTSCIGAGHIVFFVGIDAIENKAACVTIAALMQYFLMAAFCWMLVEGAYIYLFVIKVYNVNDKICRFHGLCWGLPAVMVTASLGVVAGKDGIENYVSDQYCWISSRNKVIWIFVSFVGLIELINMAILARVIKEITTIQHVKDNQSEQIRVGVRAFLVLAPLLGVTWLIGFLSPLHIAFSYMFVILNSTQGFSIFFFHCLRNSEIRERFKRRLRQARPSRLHKIKPQM
ncbi:adhesion G protein-coupled receptor L4-like [Pocillopora verrucosa]|uniref:adhesion G protein-coupled receptor L4-like n=1 Tax=Pocillopora verrucosa TaxID=203993 RepID=UPI00333EDE61